MHDLALGHWSVVLEVVRLHEHIRGKGFGMKPELLELIRGEGGLLLQSGSQRLIFDFGANGRPKGANLCPLCAEKLRRIRLLLHYAANGRFHPKLVKI